MSEPVIGVTTRTAVALEAQVTGKVWPSAQAATATTIIPYRSETSNNVQTVQAIHTVGSGPLQEPHLVTGKNVAGTYLVGLTYNNLEAIHLSCWGTAPPQDGQGNAFPINVATSAYRHRFTLARRLAATPWKMDGSFVMDGRITMGSTQMRRLTVSQVRGDKVWDRRSVLTSRWELGASAAGVVVNMTQLGYDVNKNSTLNAALAALPKPDFVRTRYRQMRVRIAPHSATVPLSPADELKMSGFRLSVQGTLTPLSTKGTGVHIDEPEWTGPRLMQGAINLHRTPAHHDFDTWQQNQTPLMMVVVFEGPPIPGGGAAYELAYYLPWVLLRDPQQGVAGPGRVRPVYPFIVYQAPTVPAGFPTVVGGVAEPMLEIVSSNPHHPQL